MNFLTIDSAVSFILGVISCHLFWKWYKSTDIEEKVSELRKPKISKKFDMGGCVTFHRPFSLGKSQEGSEDKLHGISELKLIEHDGYIEIFGAWNRNDKYQIDPFSLYMPIDLMLFIQIGSSNLGNILLN